MTRFHLPTQQTLRFSSVAETDIKQDEIVISAADAAENRGKNPLWGKIANQNPDKVMWLSQRDGEHIEVVHGGKEKFVISLRDEARIEDLIRSSAVLMDITALQHNVWSPILRCAYKLRIRTRVLYAEPESYKTHPSPASSTLFDLSVSFGGLEPLPGFAKLAGLRDDSKCLFIAMLGFEGNRPERLVMQLDPIPRVIPVVGVPGFQIEYPTFTIACNRALLEEYRAHAEIRYARASCPFEAYEILCAIKRDYPDHYMYLAPVGTKPHALGTILFAIANPASTEIMFDHPIRKVGRTSGVGTIHIYDFNNFDAYTA